MAADSWVAGGTGPSLKCPNKSDAFTVSDNTYGNGSLQYPISLLTADEVVTAGTIMNNSNVNFYLYSNLAYWLLSPVYLYANGNAYVFSMYPGGYLNLNITNTIYAIRPVISLEANLETTGDGTWNNPYIIN
jgi:hypothetical protein